MERKKILLITTAGYRYSGEVIEEKEHFIVIEDVKEGQISIPIVNISFMKEI
jgi:hypothetical protein